MNTTEKLQAIRAKCQFCIDSPCFDKDDIAGWRSTIAAIGFLERNPISVGLTRSEIEMATAIITAWEGQV